MRRRAFIRLLGGAAAAWPFAARAQQRERVRRIAILQGGLDSPHSHPYSDAFLQALAKLGWTDGQNVKVDIRWSEGDVIKAQKYAPELVALAPEVILAASALTLQPLLRVTGSVPIVFVGVVDPVGAGFVESLSRPGGNVTGFVQFDYDLSAKWLQMLKQLAPGVKRAAVLRDPANPSG